MSQIVVSDLELEEGIHRIIVDCPHGTTYVEIGKLPVQYLLVPGKVIDEAVTAHRDRDDRCNCSTEVN